MIIPWESFIWGDRLIGFGYDIIGGLPVFEQASRTREGKSVLTARFKPRK